MTGGIAPAPTDPADYRMLLTAQPFSLTAGDSQTVAFGIVMGNCLSELQTHADTMQAFYDDVFVTTDPANVGNLPKHYSLSQNYPNPFNPMTTIEFDLPKSSQVSLKIFNILGEEVATLVSNRLSTGSYSYEWDASNLASGVYLYRLQAGDYIETRKMILMR